MESDRAEQTDVSAADPEVVKKLSDECDAWKMALPLAQLFVDRPEKKNYNQMME